MKLALAALCASLTVAARCRHEGGAEAEPAAGPVHVRCEAVAVATLHETRSLRGTVAAAPDRDAVISPQVSGRLLRVAVREGDAVAAGAVVAEVESQPTRDALIQAEAVLAQNRAAELNARTALARAAHLLERGIAARQEVDDATARQAEAAATSRGAQAAVDAAARNLARATVRAPIAGVVVRVLRRAGELVDGTPATPVLEVADPSALEFVAGAAPADLVLLRAGQAASLRFDALPGRSFPARVRAVAPAIDPAAGVGTVRLALAGDPDGGARPPLGLFGEAAVDIGERAGAVMAPVAAVRGAGAGAELVVCDGNHARVRAVELGAREPARVEVLRGVAAGERVVVENALGLSDGAEIAEPR